MAEWDEMRRQVRDEMSRQARAAETKKRRTRERLIHAADHVMHEDGQSATVEAIAEEAGLSTATFYAFYSSRNALCVDAFKELVLNIMQQTYQRPSDPSDRVIVLLRLVENREELLRAALIGRLEDADLQPREDFVHLLGANFWFYDKVADGQELPNETYEATSDAMVLKILEFFVRQGAGIGINDPKVDKLRALFNVVDQVKLVVIVGHMTNGQGDEQIEGLST